MDIKILDSHLREYLDTKAAPTEIAKYVSLCGPTFDRTSPLKFHHGAGKFGKDWLYEIEVTTNRVDAASVFGIAREAAAILPQFGISAKLKKIPTTNYKLPNKNSLPLVLKSNPKLVNRLTGIVVEDIKNWESPKWMVGRLEVAGIRSLNAVVDITNYVMIAMGHPCHAFDYDKIKNHIIVVRESKKGEKITTFDNKTYTLSGGDIVFEDASGKILDLPGIMGLKNSVVSKNTKRVLFFFDNNNPDKIRQTSMGLAIRTMAAALNEKRVDPELVPTAMSLGIELFEKICKAKVASRVYDVYPRPYSGKTVTTGKDFIEKMLGVDIEKRKVVSLLRALDFKPKWSKNTLNVVVPSFRAHDVDIEEDVVEEIARIYGYHNLPSKLMEGGLPEPVFDAPFKFEENIRQVLKGFGGVETLTYSLVSKDMAANSSLKLKNPLGSDTEYLRTNLRPSLMAAIKQNSGVQNGYHLFEIANIYLQRKNDLPEERMMLSGIFVNYDHRAAKGVLEATFESLSVNHKVTIEPINNALYYEFEVAKLREAVKQKRYKPLPKYPPQIEDITIDIPEGKLVGNVVSFIKQASKIVHSIELVDIFERKFTFKISYLHPEKTLSDKEIEKARERILRACN